MERPLLKVDDFVPEVRKHTANLHYCYYSLCHIQITISVDANGFHRYPDNMTPSYGYKRIATINVTSLSAARTVCSNDLNSSLVIPYKNVWADLAIERLVQPGDQFYIGMTASNSSQPPGKIFETDTREYNTSLGLTLKSVPET
jgi:hypothetical protein